MIDTNHYNKFIEENAVLLFRIVYYLLKNKHIAQTKQKITLYKIVDIQAEYFWVAVKRARPWVEVAGQSALTFDSHCSPCRMGDFGRLPFRGKLSSTARFIQKCD